MPQKVAAVQSTHPHPQTVQWELSILNRHRTECELEKGGGERDKSILEDMARLELCKGTLPLNNTVQQFVAGQLAFSNVEPLRKVVSILS